MLKNQCVKSGQETVPGEVWLKHSSGAVVSNMGRVKHFYFRKGVEWCVVNRGKVYYSCYRRVYVNHVIGFLFIHNLVMELFDGPKPPGKDKVEHINGDRHDNRIENLRWVDQVDNPCRKIPIFRKNQQRCLTCWGK